MNPILNIKNLSPAQIDFTDLAFSISPEPDVVPEETFVKSIARYGILHPPIVLDKSPSLYTIVAGRKRLITLRSLHAAASAPCLVVSSRTRKIDIFTLLLEEIRYSGARLTMVEKAICLQKITAVAKKDEIIREFLPRLDLAPNPFSLNQTLQILNLEDSILCSLHHGQLHETVAQEFLSLSTQDRMAIFEIITCLRLNFSYQKQLLMICRDLARRSNTGIAALLESDEVRDILHHQATNPPQKTKHLMNWLRNRHKPRSRQAEEEFNRFVAALQLPQNVSVEHTPFFESDATTLSITFRDRKSLQHAWDKIRHATSPNEN